MGFEFQRKDDDLVVNLTGVLTFHHHKEGEHLVKQITTMVDKGEIKIVRLNFENVTRMDSHWLGVLIRILRRVRDKGGTFIVEKPNQDLMKLFDIVELGRIAEIRT
ncbi:MAG: STAS domain-containing protein [Alphaproteobacteria bacterium]|nr:STAS domain-containing protein [Alphaproteobacteria bacterium]